MKIFRLLFVIAVVSCLAFVSGLTGCGGGGGGDDDGDDDGGDGGTPAINVTGTWSGSFFTTAPQAYTLVLVQTGTNVTGTGTSSGGVTRSYTGTLTGNSLVLKSGTITFELTVSGNTMVGTYTDSSWTDKPANFTRS